MAKISTISGSCSMKIDYLACDQPQHKINFHYNMALFFISSKLPHSIKLVTFDLKWNHDAFHTWDVLYILDQLYNRSTFNV